METTINKQEEYLKQINEDEFALSELFWLTGRVKDYTAFSKLLHENLHLFSNEFRKKFVEGDKETLKKNKNQ